MQKQTTRKVKKKEKLVFLGRCLLCLILVICLMCLGMPETIQVFGETLRGENQAEQVTEEIDEEYKPEFNTESLSQTKEKEKYIEFEDINKRTETEKHYYMSDGTYMSETFMEPVHYTDEDGKLQDIDNSLIEFSKDGKQKVKNAGNSFSAEFAAVLSKDSPIFSLAKDEYKLDMYLDSEFEANQQNNPILSDIALDKEGSSTKNSKVSDGIIDKTVSTKKDIAIEAQINKSDKYVETKEFSYKNKKLKKGVDNQNLTSELKYKEAINGIDFEYIVEQNSVKENIIVNQRQDNYKYRFILEVEGLELYLRPDGHIDAVNWDFDVIYNIPAPFMYDANGEHSYTVRYMLKELEEHKYELRVIADEEWINSDERAFPIVIDPSVVITSEKFEITRITNGGGVSTGSGNWYVRQTLNGSSKSRLVFRYQPGWDYNKVQLARELDFEITKTELVDVKVECYLTRASYWPTPNWDLMNEIKGDKIFSCTATGSWKSHTIPFEGYDLMFQIASENGFTITEASFRNFKVRDYYLVFSKHYVDFSEDMFTLGFDAITYGTSLIIPYYVQEAPIMPISVYALRVPDFSMLKQAYLGNTQDFYGKDWKLNVEQYMIESGSGSDISYTYIGENGIPNVLSTKEVINGITYYVNEEGMAYNPSTRWLGRKGNRQMHHFDSLGRLDKIQNSDGQFNEIIYDQYGRIEDIDLDIRKNTSGSYTYSAYVRLYYTNNLLSSIKGNASQLKSTFSYDSSNRLTDAVIEGRSINISYSTEDKITSVVNNDGHGYSLSYVSSYVDVKEYPNTKNYTRFEGSGEQRTAKYFQNSKQIFTTTYAFNYKNILLSETTEYIAYDGITPSKNLTTFEKSEKTISGYKHSVDVTTQSILKSGSYEIQSQVTVDKTIEGTNKGAITITKSTRTESNITDYNIFGQKTLETIVKGNETYRNFYSYKSSNDEIPNKNHLLLYTDSFKDSVWLDSIEYYYQNDSTADKTARGLVTSIKTYKGSKLYNETFDYDTYGNVIKYQDADGIVYNYYYAFKGASNISMIESDINGTNSIQYNYNTYGRFESSTNAAGTSRYLQNTKNEQYSFGSLYYDYNYLNNGSISTIQRNASTMITYGYDTAYNLSTKTFANNQKMDYTYDTYGNLKTKKSYHGTTVDPISFTYGYNSEGNLASVAYDGYTKSYTYPDYAKNQLESTVTLKKSGQSDYVIKNAYDKDTELHNSTTYTINGVNRVHSVSYKDEMLGTLNSEKDGSFSTSYNYLNYNTISYQQTNLSSSYYRRTYQRGNNVNRVTSIEDLYSYGILSSVTYKTDISYASDGNISNLARKRTSDNYQFNNVTYTYDTAGRVKTEKNTVFGKQYLYEYDANNNVKSVTEYNTNGTVYNIQTYNYSSYDRLTSITNSNTALSTRSYTVDALGNHLTYNGLSLAWTRGRMLDTITDTANTKVSFKYDENGIRYEKKLTTNAGAINTTKYYMDGSRIIAEDRNGTLIHYYYNQTGVVGMRYGGVDYIFLKDALGSITEIVNSSGVLYAQYAYDAWGNMVYKTSGGLSDINPFRYRGYYMDIETGFYYLQTRYYDPYVRRFISADNYELAPILSKNIGELNMYSYCNNNPIIYSDGSGMFSFKSLFNKIDNFFSGIGYMVGSAITSATDWATGVMINAVNKIANIKEKFYDELKDVYTAAELIAGYLMWAGAIVAVAGAVIFIFCPPAGLAFIAVGAVIYAMGLIFWEALHGNIITLD